MTILTDREVSRFRDLYDKKEWAEIAKYGEELLKKDPRDGMAIRFGVLDAYTVLGNSKGAEELLIRYCDYAEDEDDDPFHYRSRRFGILGMKNRETHGSHPSDLDTDTALQWRTGRMAGRMRQGN